MELCVKVVNSLKPLITSSKSLILYRWSFFEDIVNSFKLSTTFTQSSILDVSNQTITKPWHRHSCIMGSTLWWIAVMIERWKSHFKNSLAARSLIFFRCTAIISQNMSSAVLEELCCVFSSFRFFRVFVASLINWFVGVFSKASHF